MADDANIDLEGVITNNEIMRLVDKIGDIFAKANCKPEDETLIGNTADSSGYSFTEIWLKVTPSGVIVEAGTKTHTVPQLINRVTDDNGDTHFTLKMT